VNNNNNNNNNAIKTHQVIAQLELVIDILHKKKPNSGFISSNKQVVATKVFPAIEQKPKLFTIKSDKNEFKIKNEKTIEIEDYSS